MRIVAQPNTRDSDRGLARPAIEALHARDCRPSDYLVDGGFTKTTISSGRMQAVRRCGARLGTPNMAPIHMRPSRATVRPSLSGASAWQAISAKTIIDAEPSTSASMPVPGAWDCSKSPSAAKTRPARFCCGRAGPQHDVRLQIGRRSLGSGITTGDKGRNRVPQDQAEIRAAG
jgi:hypothetical protein